MLRHIVFFTARNPEDLDTIHQGLSLLTDIPDCLHIEIGTDVKPDDFSPITPDFVVYAEFESEQQLAAFKQHPNYQKATATVRPLRDVRIAADYQTPPA